ncbi:hypothetical protein N9N67_07370 [Bacteriovoracaceae bacterium]|nr:hypothetical protein [Bacteriovoracaceae bacterium]
MSKIVLANCLLFLFTSCGVKSTGPGENGTIPTTESSSSSPLPSVSASCDGSSCM